MDFSLMSNWLDEVKFDSNGLVPAIAQHHQTGRVLMVAWMNREALQLTAEKIKPCITHVHVKNCGTKAKNQGTSKQCMKFVWIAMPM
jgi:phosphoribosyl-AMP cyclohydrolase